MLGHLIGDYAGSLPLIALLIFVTISTFVTLYVLTDQRRQHHRRMEALPLDDARDTKGPDRV